MRERYDALYLSPHLDDAVLSCGGQIFQRTRRGQRVLVYTTMAQEDIPPPPSPHAAHFLAMCGLGPDAGRIRRREDEKACERLGAEFGHDVFPEAIYRLAPNGQALYPTLESLFDAVRAEDERFQEELEARLTTLPFSASVFAPLGIGGHVDHQLVRRAAERIHGRALQYYEDYPYANKIGAAARFLRPRRLWRAQCIPLSPGAFQARCEAIMDYASQYRMLFRSARAMRWKLRLYAWRVGGERVWKKTM